MLRSLIDLQAFLRVAHSLNFTKAAGDLRVTPTAISKAIARLESDLGSQLFIRTTRSVQLTEAGEIFLRHCTAAFNEIGAGLDALDVLRDETTGTVRVSAPFVLGRRLAASLPDLMAHHPKLQVQLSLTDEFVDLTEDKVDIAIRIGEAKLGVHFFAKLARLNWVTAASPRYLKQMGTPQSLDDLNGHKCHHFVNTEGSIVPWTFQQGDEIVQVTPQGGALFNQGELFVQVALADGGIVQVFDFMIADALRDGDLVRLFPDQEADGPDVYALIQRGRANAPKLNAAVLHLRRLFEQW